MELARRDERSNKATSERRKHACCCSSAYKKTPQAPQPAYISLYFRSTQPIKQSSRPLEIRIFSARFCFFSFRASRRRAEIWICVAEMDGCRLKRIVLLLPVTRRGARISAKTQSLEDVLIKNSFLVWRFWNVDSFPLMRWKCGEFLRVDRWTCKYLYQLVRQSQV